MRSWLGALALLLAFATSPQQEAEARGAEGTFCMECEAHYFFAWYGDEGQWWPGERCVSASQVQGFNECTEDYYPGNFLYEEPPYWTCRAQGLQPCLGIGGNPGGGSSGELQLASYELGLDGRVAVDPRRLDISADVIEIRNCDQWLLWTAATTTD
jgi:hypothetical protein